MIKILLAAGLLASLFALPVTVIKNGSGQPNTKSPVTLSLSFCEGELSAPIGLSVSQTAIGETQWDIKRNWPNGTIKHALVSFVLPTLAAGDSVAVTLNEAAQVASNLPFSKDSLLATDFEAQAVFVKGGVTYTASARELLQNSATLTYWLQGSIVNEWILRGKPKTTSVVADSDLCVQFLVRTYKGVPGAEVSFVVENIYESRIHDIVYDVTLTTGHTSPVTVYSKTGVQQYYCTRWRKDFTWGRTATPLEIRNDIPYLISTGLLQRYNLNSKIADSQKNGEIASWNSTAKDILEFGKTTAYMPMTGGRPDIGPNPGWVARWILCQENWAKEIACVTANLGGSFSVHYRESDSTRLINITKRPMASLNWWCYAQSDANIKQPVGSCSSPAEADDAHMPNLFYVPYLLTGDYYYLEELYYWVNWLEIQMHWSYRGFDRGIMIGQTRAVAWMLRTLAEVAAIAPTSDSEQVYFDKLIRNNLTYRDSLHLKTSKVNPLGIWELYDGTREYSPGDFSCMLDNTVYNTSPWMDDFVTFTMDHIVDLGYSEARALRDFKVKFPAGRYGSDSAVYNPYDGSPYRVATVCTTGTTYRSPSSFSELHQWTFAKGCTNGTNFDKNNEYHFWARCALSAYSRLDSTNPAAQKGYDFLNNRLASGDLSMNQITDFLPGPSRTIVTAAELNNNQTSRKGMGLRIYPNPANPSTTLNYSLPEFQMGHLAIYDAKGQEIKSFDLKKGGKGTLVWDGTNRSNEPVASGIYFARLNSGEALVSTRPFVLMR